MVTGITLRSFAGRNEPAALPFGLTRWQLACLLVLLLAAVAYLPSLSGTFFWDDVPLVNGKAIGGGDTLRHCFTRPFLQYYYRPLVSVSFYLENRIADFSPAHYHQTNILLHVLATAWLIRLLHFAFRNQSAALLGGLLFAVQPAQVGGVAWIGGRTDALCGLLMIAFADTLLRGARAVGKRRAVCLAFSAFVYFLALLTKEQMLGALPLVPLAFRLFPPEGREAERGEGTAFRAGWKASLPFAGIALAFVALAARFGPPLTKAPLGHTSPLLSSSRTILYYALLLLAPSPRWMHTLSLSAFAPLGGAVVPLGLGIAAALLCLFLRWVRTSPAAAWFSAWTLCLALPVSNALPLPSLLVAPYRIAAAGIGVAGILGFLLAGGMKNAAKFRFAVPRTALAALLALWYFGLTWWGSGLWHDTHTFFGAIKNYDSGCLSARYNLAGAYIQERRPQEALAEIEPLLSRWFGPHGWQNAPDVLHAVAHNPHLMSEIEDTQGGRTPLRERIARLYVLLGAARLLNRDAAGAHSAYAIGYALDRNNAKINAGLGECARQAGNLPESIRCLRRATAMDDQDAERVTHRAMLAQALMAAGQWRQAQSEWRECVRLSPDSGGVYYIPLANAELHLGDRAAARATLYSAGRTTVRPIALRALADLQAGRTPRL